jgi:hypothetical protein
MDRPEKIYALDFEDQLARLAAHHRRGRIIISTPVFAGPFPVDEIPRLVQLARASLAARAWISRHGPPWAHPLPLTDIERIEMFLDERPERHLGALYSISLQARDYGYLGHPLPFDFARGVMACEYAHKYLREDRALRAEFPPKELAGFDQFCRWRPLQHRVSQLIESPVSKWVAGYA